MSGDSLQVCLLSFDLSESFPPFNLGLLPGFLGGDDLGVQLVVLSDDSLVLLAQGGEESLVSGELLGEG